MSVQEQDGLGSARGGSISTEERVTEAASSKLTTAGDATKDVVGQATDQTKAVAAEAKAQAQQLVSNARSEIHTQADDRTRQAADQLRGLSGSIEALLSGRPDDAAQIRGYLEQARSKIDGFAGRLEARGPQGVVDDLSAFARRRPGAFLMAAGVAGFAVGRAARAGAQAAHEQRSPAPRSAVLQPGGV